MSGHLRILNREERLSQLDPKLRVVYEGDPKWRQLFDERNHQAEEHNRFLEEIEELKKTNAESKHVKILELRKQVAASKSRVACYQQRQRQSELEKSQVEDDLKAATSHQEREGIQQRLKEVDGRLQSYKSDVHYWEKVTNQTGEKLKQLESTIKEEESQQLLDEALKQGYLLMRFMICLMVGPPGVGKTCLKHLLLGKHPPHPCERCSTICAEHPVKIRSISSSKIQTMLGKWREVSPEQLLPSIGRFIRRNAKKHRVSIPNELKEYLEQLEASANAATVSSKAILPMAAGSDDVAAESNISLQSSDGSQSSTALDEASALKATVDSIFATLKKVIAGEDLSEEEVEELFSSDWVYFTDCGGQPQFHELLPLFIQEITSLIVVSRLSDRLDDRPPDEYYQQGKLVGKKSATHLTTAEQVKCLTRSLMSRATEGSCPDIIMVGTHRDRASECSESIEEKNEKLLEMFGPELEEHLVFYEGVKGLLFPLNTFCPDEQDKAVAKTIQVGVETSMLVKEVKVPIWWFILELLIQGLAKKLEKRVLRRELCVSIAHALGFTERAFEAALKFFDKLNVIKYSTALPEVIFVDSQVPLDNVSDLVQEGYLLRHGRPSSRRGNWKRFCYEGVVTLKFIDSTCKHFEKGIFESAELLELLKDQLVVVPLEPLSDIDHLPEADEYFMPALLDILSQDELEKHRVFSSAAAPLLFRFSHGCRRAGVFCCLVVYLMKESKWSIQHRNGKLILVARNCVSFRVTNDDRTFCLVTLMDAFYFFEVHITADTPLSLCRELCPTIQREIFAGIRAACEKLCYISDQPQLAVFCPSCDCTIKGIPSSSDGGSRHAAVLEKNSCACIETSHHACLTDRHTIWLAEESQATTGEQVSATIFSTLQSKPSNEVGTLSASVVPSTRILDLSTQQSPPLSRPDTSATPSLPLTGCDQLHQSLPQYPPSSASYLPQVWLTEQFQASTLLTSLPTARTGLPAAISASQQPISSASGSTSLYLFPTTQSMAVTSPAQSTPASASHLPHIPEYVSISSQMTEEQNDMSKPTSFNLTMIMWKNERGETMKFGVKQSVMHKWRDIGDLVVPWQQLEVWANEKDAKACCSAVLSYWLQHPSHNYPATWEGLYELLNDSELSQVASKLRQAVDNAI